MNLGILIQLIIMELTGRGYLGTAPSSSPTQEEKENVPQRQAGRQGGTRHGQYTERGKDLWAECVPQIHKSKSTPH